MRLFFQVGSSPSRAPILGEQTHSDVIFNVGLSNRLVSGEGLSVVVVVEDEVLLNHLAIQKVDDNHVFVSI